MTKITVGRTGEVKEGMGKTALVLSAGGFFGAYQVGVWKALSEEIRPDIVIGASVGALNGWCIAGGATAEELEEQWLHESTAENLTLRKNPGLRNGYFESSPLLNRAERLFRDYRPQVPFGLVVVELPWLTARLVQNADITPRHLLATCSIPIVMSPVKIRNKSYTDGALLEKLPLWAAAEMGATHIIAVDSLPEVVPWWVKAGMSVLRAVRRPNVLAGDIEVTMIRPTETMGTAHDAVIWKRENIRRWIDMGQRDAARLFALQ